MTSEILLLTPPFTQLNTPYPATAYLKGFLNTKQIKSYQADLGIEVILEIFSANGLKNIFDFSESKTQHFSENARRIYSLQYYYTSIIDEVILFLQGKNPSLAHQICAGGYFPQGARFNQLEDLEWAFGSMGFQDKAKHLATLFLEDLSDFIVECVDSNFGFSRYAEKLGRSANTFDEIYATLAAPLSYIDTLTIHALQQKIVQTEPKIIAITVPFPGNLLGAFRCAQFVKTQFPEIKIALGGGFANTELRSVSDRRVFDFFDFICLDQGELPIYLLINQYELGFKTLKRTFRLLDNEIIFQDNSELKDFTQTEVGVPDYSDLPLDKYISVIEVTNPMHSLWSDGRWNKLTLAHGCYWAKCTFCDISLAYIQKYEPSKAKELVDKIEIMKAQTGQTGFHFVDEAAPPALMRDLALELIRRKTNITWWTNIRFEKSFTADICGLLKMSGCIAVSGGLEVASDRLLDLIEKGVSVEQVAKVCRNFTESGIMVHAYLMYGFPSQTVQETVDSLEMVRQMFELGIIKSGFWHQFALTAHSPVGLNPEKYHIKPKYKTIEFANNDIDFSDNTGLNHDKFSYGLKKSLYNFMQGICLDFPLQEWFEFKIPATKVAKYYISDCLEKHDESVLKSNSKIVWLGVAPSLGIKKVNNSLVIEDKFSSETFGIRKEMQDNIIALLEFVSIENPTIRTFAEVKTKFETTFGDFSVFWQSDLIRQLTENGLMVL